MQLDLQYVESQKNKADAPSSCLSQSDSKLSDDVFVMMDPAFGGSTGHSFHIMALDSNGIRGKDALPLPHFSAFQSPCSDGVNLFCQDLRSVRHMSNPYVFPPLGLIGPILRFLVPFKIPFTIVIPEFVPHSYWWPESMAPCRHKLCIAK